AFGRRNQAFLGEVTFFTERLLAGVLRDEFRDARNYTDVRLLHVDEQRARRGVLARRDGLEAGRHTVDHRALQLVDVLLEEAVAEDAHGILVGRELLHDEVVVFAGFDVRTVFTYGVAGALEARLVLRTQRLQPGKSAAARFQVELGKRIARARGRRRPQHFDLHRRKRLVDVFPGVERVGDQRGRIRRIRHGLRQRQVHVAAREHQRVAGLALCNHDAVVAHLDLDDFLDAVLRAGLELGGTDAARRVRDVGKLRTDAVAKQLQAATGTGAFDLGRFEFAGASELFRHRGGEGIDGGRSDDIDGIARRLGVGV